MKKVGRNDACPCGSGKKYKNCCLPSPEAVKEELDSFALNREIAYKGQVGHLREEFCINFIQNKQEVLKELQKKHNEIALARSSAITCGKGCYHCCVLFVGASIQEGEAIVYYLYQNEGKLYHFLKTYPVWRARIKESGDLFRKQPPGDNKITAGVGGGLQYENIGDLAEYARLNIPCPFLRDGICSIYEVRPFVCAGLIVTTPAEWCNPRHPEHTRKKTYQISSTYLPKDRSFYGKDLEKPVWSFMPIMVYNMLEYGLAGMPGMAGMESLLYRYIHDPEVQPVIRRFVNLAKGIS
jgi:Fe-S-cluster containining protein